MEGWMNGNKVLPFVGMVMVILGQSGSNVVIKAAMSDGMNKYVMVVYTLAISTLVLLPFVLFFQGPDRPPLKFSTLYSFFLLAIFGSCGMIFAYVGIDLSSPSVASATLNLVPALTFVLALIFRMEEVHWRELSSQAKVLGTIASIAGAFVIIFYKGPPIFMSGSSNLLVFSPKLNWILGGLFCAADSLVTAMWYIYQASVIRKYPDVMVIVFFEVLFSTIQCSIYALITVRDPSAWQLQLDMGLIAIFYQGIVSIAIRYLICTWCVQRAGPLFCAMFKPIGIIFTVIIGAVFLGDNFYLGSLIGAVIIVMGFYAVMWGKASQEKTVKRGIENLESACHNVPLLQNKA